MSAILTLCRARWREISSRDSTDGRPPLGWDVPTSPFNAPGRVAAVGRHDLSGDCRLVWLSTHVHLPTFACRLPSGQQSLFEQPGSQQTEHAMSITLNSSSEIPWWKEPSKEQWKAWIAAWLGWTLDAFDFTIFLLIMVPIAKEFDVPLTAGTVVFPITLWLSLVGATASRCMACRLGPQ